MNTIKKIRVEQFHLKNQFIIKTSDGTYFQSYNSIIAFEPSEFGKKTVLDKYLWNYSTTTGKYRNLFLCDSGIAETRKKIESGEYILDSLN
jgi:hypothetical protein